MTYIVIDEKEFGLRDKEIQLTSGDVSELLEYKRPFTKFLDKCIHKVQAQLFWCELQGKENEAYVAIDTIIRIKKDLEDLQWVYNKYLEDQSKEKK